MISPVDMYLYCTNFAEPAHLCQSLASGSVKSTLVLGLRAPNPPDRQRFLKLNNAAYTSNFGYVLVINKIALHYPNYLKRCISCTVFHLISGNVMFWKLNGTLGEQLNIYSVNVFNFWYHIPCRMAPLQMCSNKIHWIYNVILCKISHKVNKLSIPNMTFWGVFFWHPVPYLQEM